MVNVNIFLQDMANSGGGQGDTKSGASAWVTRHCRNDNQGAQVRRNPESCCPPPYFTLGINSETGVSQYFPTGSLGMKAGSHSIAVRLLGTMSYAESRSMALVPWLFA